MDDYGTAGGGGGGRYDEYHRPLPSPQPHLAQPPSGQGQEQGEGLGQSPLGLDQAGQRYEGAVPRPGGPGGVHWPLPQPSGAATQMLPPYPAYAPPAPTGPPGSSDATQLLPPQASGSAAVFLPGSADATQLLPPQTLVPPGSSEATHMLPPPQAPMPPRSSDATQLLPPQASGSAAVFPPGSADATQLLPPQTLVPPGSSEATHMLPPPQAPMPPRSSDATQLLPPQAPMPPRSSDATQLLPPQASGPRTDQATAGFSQGAAAAPADPTQWPPSAAGPGQSFAAPQPPQPQGDFDHLYRQDGPPLPAPWSPQPPVTVGRQAANQPPPAAPPAPAPPAPPAPRRGLSRGTLIGIVVGACALVGITLGAVLSGDDSGSPAAAETPGTTAVGTPSAVSSVDTDPARAQAVQLDALLERSGASRSSVIQAVADIKSCQNLDGAASDLRAAAGQRRSLITGLGQLSIDRLANHQALSAALTSAWQASAAADEHYAAWADQTSGAKGCKHGQARVTGETARGNAQSGVATEAKKAAVRLWNAIARQYGLTQRTFTQI